MIPTFPIFADFYKIDPAVYLELVRNHDPYSDYNFISVFSWNQPGSCYVSLLNGNLVLSLKDYLGDEQVLTFLGNNKVPETAKELLDYVKTKDNYKKELQLIPKIVANELHDLSDFEVLEDHDNHDYILSASQSVEFYGKRYLKKRQRLNKFEKNYGDAYEIRFVDLNDKSIQSQILDLDSRWTLMGTDGSKDAENERPAILKLLNSYNDLSKLTDLQCITMYIDNRLVAFIIFEIAERYAVDHFAKSELSITSCSEFLLAKLLNYIDEKYNIDDVNIEQDLGIPGLREHKMSHSPNRFLQKYIVKERF